MTLHCFGARDGAAASKRGTGGARSSRWTHCGSTIRAVLRERLAKLDLVTRDEFEAQTRVLARTRARLEELEARLAALEGAPET